MIAAFLERAGQLSLREVDVPEYRDDEVLVRVSATGICGSDLHYFREGRVGKNVITEPLVLGHECAGEVVAVGSEVSPVAPGDRVAVEPGVPCGRCELCLAGYYNLCDNVRFLGAPPTHGTFREFISHKALFVHKLPENVSLEQGACLEPLAVAYHCVSRAAIRPGERVLVMGGGPVGLMTMMLCRIAGAVQVSVADIDDYRLEVGRSLGADAAINALKQELPENTFDCVVEATGAAGVYASVIRAVKKRGRIAVIGMSNTAPQVDLTAMMRKEADILTVYRYRNCFQPVIRILESGRLDVAPLVSHRFPIERIKQAFDLAGDPKQDKMKILVHGPGESPS